MMNIFESMPLHETPSDAELVTACLGGDREVFGRIVNRYQRLLCSLAYSSLGNLAASEDVAQETFIAAWTQLAKLRDPDKLRPWLCGILRHQVSRRLRKDRREPSREAIDVDEREELASGDESVPTRVMAQEEQDLLWHTLSQLPARYREPLVLYYREHRSIEHVAAELELTEANVKQRLSRGRKMLKEQALNFVEGALTRSAPGPLFTAGVMVALPVFSPPAKAAGLATATAAVGKGAGSAAKVTVFAAVLASVSGLVSSVMALRMNLDQSRTERERRKVVVGTAAIVGSFMGFIAVLFGLLGLATVYPVAHVPIIIVNQVLIVAFLIWWPWLLLRHMREQAELRAEERCRHPERFADARFQKNSRAAEYRSRTTFLGVPLLHLRFGMQEVGQKPVFGWIAIGDRAIGLLFAWGGLSVGFCSVGALSFGVFSFGGVGFGIMVAGAVCVGWWAMGAIAIGVHALASFSATAWETAQGGFFALSSYVARAKFAVAPHANDALAWLTLHNPDAGRDWFIFSVAVIILTLVPITLYARAVRRRFKPQDQ
jgi:RNA polymerase sigma factor (sigma-70 family)